MKVEQLMTRSVKRCHPQDTLSCPAQIMWDSDVGCAPVVDDGDRVVGMITDRDIAMAAHLRGLKVDEMTVGQAMETQMHCCRPDDDITQAEIQMRRYQVRRLPVTDAQSKLLGLLSLNDLARAGSRHRADIAPANVATTLAQIGQRRTETMATTA